MDDVIIDTISSINYKFIKEWFKNSFIKPDYEEGINLVKKLFTEGGCAIYGEFLYNVFKDYGVVLGKNFDHIIIKYNDNYYDAVSGFEPNSKYLKESVLRYGFTEFDLKEEKGKEEFEFYKDACCKLYDKSNRLLYGNYDDCIKIFNSMQEEVIEIVKTALDRNKIKILKRN